MTQDLDSPEAVLACLAEFCEAVNANGVRPEAVACELLKMVDLTPDSNGEIDVVLPDGREVFSAYDFLNMSIGDFIGYDYGCL